MRRYGLSLVSEPFDHTTGVVTYSTELVRHLLPLLSTDEKLVVFRHARFPAPAPVSDRLEERVLRFPGATRSSVRRLAEQSLLPLAATRARLTLLHCVQNFGPVCFAGPQVLTVHDVRLFRGREKAGVRGLWRQLVYPASVRRAARLLGDSAWAADRAAEAFGIARERIRVVPLAVDHASFGNVTDEDRVKVAEKLEIKGPALVFAGLFGPNKNLPRVLDAFAALSRRDVTLVLAGGGGADDALVRERIRALGLGDRVRLPGYLERRELVALVSLARALVFPSLEEGFGLPVLEAFASGTAVLTSNRGALLEVAGDAALTVDPEDTGAIGRGIERLLSDEVLRADLVARGRERARAYTWERCARETLEVYRSL